MISPELFNIIAQGGFATLAVYLIITGRMDSQAREKALIEREGKTQGLLEKYATEFNHLNDLMIRQTDLLSRQNEILTRLEARLESRTERIERERTERK